MYHDFEKSLFEAWQARSEKLGDGEIAPDGLHYKGEIVYDGQYWGREPGNEEKLWENAPKRLLFLTKDLNDTDAWDIRAETGRKNSTGEDKVTALFYKRLMMWTYGIAMIHATTVSPDFRTASDYRIFRPCFERFPTARVNCKKTDRRRLARQIRASLLPGALRRFIDTANQSLRRRYYPVLRRTGYDQGFCKTCVPARSG